MKKMFTRNLCLYMLIALIIAIIAVFTLQTFSSKNSNMRSAKEKLTTVREKLASNDEEIANLKNNLGENNLVKTRAFADMLASDASLLSNPSKLKKLCDRLVVNELHVIDEKGIITHSSIDSYVGFDMNSGEQAAAFMVIVDDPSIEIVQEPQQNVAEGTIIQYIGVARTDAKGLVQVGIRPEILENMLANTRIDVVLKDVDFGARGYVYAIDKNTGEILAHPNEALIGTPATAAGFSDETTGGDGRIRVDGVSGYYVSEEYENMLIGTFMPSSEYFSGRTSQTIVVAITIFVIFMALLIMINRMVEKGIVNGIDNISRSLKKIAAGDFNVIVDEKGNDEFIQLSDSINKMVTGIRENISENQQLVERQKTDMESSLMLINNVKSACSDLESVSKDTLSSADDIYNGTEKQKKAVSGLEQVMNELVTELNMSADETTKVTSTTGTAVNTIMQAQIQMESLRKSINEISEMSIKIEKIIDEINSIAEQTNLLALNASIEAARVGDMGKGFAVVATQVGELAARSSHAAKETNELITNSIRAINSGKEITEDTVETFNHVVDAIGRANDAVEEIAGMVRENVSVVSQAVAEIDKINGVVNANVEISQNSKQISNDMVQITEQLLTLVNQKNELH